MRCFYYRKVLPNATLHVTREQLSAGALIEFVHYFEITNFGPSHWPYLDAELKLAKRTSLSSGIQRCKGIATGLNCSFNIRAHVSFPVKLPLTFDLKRHGDKLEENGVYEATTLLILNQYKMNASLTTRLVLMTAPPLWPPVVGAVAGLLLLAAILYALYKCGFFKRKRPRNVPEAEPLNQGHTSRRSPVGSLRNSVVDVNQPSDPQLQKQSN
ncbi:Integrin alpha-PS3 [Eumeta japonica]|uniref:Integrin alpha-PS3 n=1 Tax=Eumeta variegata TaxID=151549 RepID=A0A4C2A5Z4_EUMVA|nr:Integrin alpha-PS3 [Eumeta japonica]